MNEEVILWSQEKQKLFLEPFQHLIDNKNIELKFSWVWSSGVGEEECIYYEYLDRPYKSDVFWGFIKIKEEDEDISFIQWMIQQKIDYWLERKEEQEKEVV